jgi:hypothetical protein
MSTEVQQILNSVRALSSKDRQELAMALEQAALMPPARANAALIRSIQGKYAHVRTSSDEFMARKREDLVGEQ